MTRTGENDKLPIHAKIALAKAAKGPVRRIGLEHVMDCYVIWRFADNIDGAKLEKKWVRQDIPSPVEPDSMMRLRFRVGRTGEARLLSHLETADAWIRALRRAKAPVSYSRGFHAHARVNFSSALPVGEESTGEYMDVVLSERLDAAALFERLRATVPMPTVLLPFLDGERTPNFPYATGLLYGIRHDTTPGQILQAAYDGAAYALLAALDRVLATGSADAGGEEPILLIGGGARGVAWRETSRRSRRRSARRRRSRC